MDEAFRYGSAWNTNFDAAAYRGMIMAHLNAELGGGGFSFGHLLSGAVHAAGAFGKWVNKNAEKIAVTALDVAALALTISVVVGSGGTAALVLATMATVLSSTITNTDPRSSNTDKVVAGVYALGGSPVFKAPWISIPFQVGNLLYDLGDWIFGK